MKTLREKIVVPTCAFAATLAAVACSPIDPSVSKMSASSAAASPLKASSPSTTNTGITSGPGTNMLVSTRAFTASNGATQVTQLQTFAQFHGSSWSLVQNAKPAFELDSSAIADFKASGLADFASPALDKVRGEEDALSSSKTAITLVFNADAATVTNLGLADLQANLKWFAASSASSAGHWELSVVAPNTGDPVKDMSEYKQLVSAIQENLVAVTIEFQAD